MPETRYDPYTDEEIGRRIADIRKKKKLSLYQLALNSDVDRTLIGRVEKNERGIEVSTLLRIVNGLGISPKEFFQIFT